jgi:hypothetical protein
MGRPANNLAVGFAISRAQRCAFMARALSLAIPVFAYICRYSFEMSTKATRPLSFVTHRLRFQMAGRR